MRRGKTFAWPGLHGLAPVDLGGQSLVAAEERGARRAHLGASGDIALGQFLLAELALGDAREGRVVLELRHVEWARRDAVAAADAGVRIVGDDPRLRILGHGLDRADRDARGIDAMQALPLDVGEAVLDLILVEGGAVLVHLDDGVGLAGQLERSVPKPAADIVIERQLVGRFARRHARLAADAERRVVEQADGVFRHGLVFPRLRGAGAKGCASGRGCGAS